MNLQDTLFFRQPGALLHRDTTCVELALVGVSVSFRPAARKLQTKKPQFGNVCDLRFCATDNGRSRALWAVSPCWYHFEMGLRQLGPLFALAEWCYSASPESQLLSTSVCGALR